MNPEHTYASFGNRTVTLTVDDGYVPAHPATATHTATPSPGTQPPGHDGLVPDTPRTDQPEITDGEIWDIEVVGNRVYVAGDFTSIRQPNNGAVVDQAGLAAYDLEHRPDRHRFPAGVRQRRRRRRRGLAGRHQALRRRQLRHRQRRRPQGASPG